MLRACRLQSFIAQCLASLAGLIGIFACAPANAGDAATDVPPVAEVWSGAQITQNSWYAYSGIVYALGGDVLADGWRLRATGGGGAYSYQGRLPSQPLDSPDITFQGAPAAGDIAVGYQQRYGAMIAKAFLGASYVDHRIVPEDVFNDASGQSIGVIATVDLWVDFDASTWALLCATYNTALSSYSADVSAGYRVAPDVSLGIEAGVFGNESLEAGRLGALVKWDTAYGELTAAAGLSGDYADPSTPYGRISWLSRF